MAIIATAKQSIRIGEPGHVEGKAPKGRLSAVFEDDGNTGYFYALDYVACEQPIVDALHVYNVASVADASTPSEVVIGWSLDSTKAVLLINGQPHAVLDFHAKHGYCRTGFPPALPNAGWSGHNMVRPVSGALRGRALTTRPSGRAYRAPLNSSVRRQNTRSGEGEIAVDIFTRFNRKSIDDRQIDTLIGISKGIIADGKVDQSEAEFLMSWLVQSRQASDNPVIANLLAKVGAMLQDQVLDSEELAELLGILRGIAGDPSEVGELAKSASLPLNNPAPNVVFPSRHFVFTGTCAYGTRTQCHQATEALGGVIATGINKSVTYVVLGTYVTDSWAHETYGRKIEKAVQYREQGVPLAIITEEHWANAGHLGVAQPAGHPGVAAVDA